MSSPPRSQVPRTKRATARWRVRTLRGCAGCRGRRARGSSGHPLPALVNEAADVREPEEEPEQRPEKCAKGAGYVVLHLGLLVAEVPTGPARDGIDGDDVAHEVDQ